MKSTNAFAYCSVIVLLLSSCASYLHGTSAQQAKWGNETKEAFFQEAEAKGVSLLRFSLEESWSQEIPSFPKEILERLKKLDYSDPHKAPSYQEDPLGHVKVNYSFQTETENYHYYAITLFKERPSAVLVQENQPDDFNESGYLFHVNQETCVSLLSDLDALEGGEKNHIDYSWSKAA